MDEHGFDTLVQTLVSNHLASSHSEATRMAEEMLGTSKKVNESFQRRHHYAVKNFSPEGSTSQPEVTTAPASEKKQEALQSKIQELRQRALNPEPVNVQVEFDTPNDAPSISDSHPTQAKEPLLQKEMRQADSAANSQDTQVEEAAASRQINEIKTDAQATTQATSAASPSLSPEEYSARQLGGLSLNDTMDAIQQDEVNKETTPKESKFTEEAEPTQTSPLQEQSDFTKEPSNENSDEKRESDNQQATIDSSSPFTESLPNSQFNESNSQHLKTETTGRGMKAKENDFLSLKQEPNENPQVEENNNQPSEPSDTVTSNTEISSGWPDSSSQSTTNSQMTQAPNQNRTTNSSPSTLTSHNTPSQEKEDEHIAEKTQEIKTPAREATWTEEEKKLKEEVDLSRLFNFSNR